MILTKKHSAGLLLLFLLIASLSCETEKRFPPKGYIPNTPKATEKLEAAYFWVPQDQLNSSYWKDANYVELTLTDGATKNLYGEGYLNMTGTYNGVKDFNKGRDTQATIKAGYDEEYLYLLVEWKDTTADASNMTRLLFGDEDPIKPTESADGWTSQRNQDALTITFGNTSEVKDAWKWSMASTAPLNMAINLDVDNDGSLMDNSGILVPNTAEDNATSGPRYEWSGKRQEIVLADGSSRLLDPAYYLLDMDSMKIDFVGDVELGKIAFNDRGDCKLCHGLNGNGDIAGDAPSNGGPLNQVFTNRYTRNGLVNYMKSTGHDGRRSWQRIESDSVDVLAFMRGIAGQPGHTLAVPQNTPEIRAYTNVAVGTVQSKNSSYTVLLRRKLTNANTEDIQFDPVKSYPVSIHLSDNDDINFISSASIEMIFNPK